MYRYLLKVTKSPVRIDVMLSEVAQDADMLKNLRNVAIPGTGIPLSMFCWHQFVATAFLVLGLPIVSLVAALFEKGLHGFGAACETNGVPASPWLTAPKLIIKHRNEEGGLGFQVFTNATAGGDWIIQRALVNSEHLAR
eukprot:6213639-Pleurochrysis_carterae.AAC.2